MNLLRVSNFCRPSPSSSTDVAIEVTTKLAKNEKVENLHCCSVGWVTVDVLISLSCLEGSFSWLTFGSTKWLLRLFLLKENDEEQITDDDSIDYSRSHQVFIPPIIAINLSMKGGKCMGILTTTNEMPWKAQRIILKPFGHPACWPRLEPKSNTSRTDDGEFWLYPRTQTMVQGSSLLSVYDSACDRVCYYVVTAIIPEKDLGSSFDCFITSPSTTFQLDDSSILSDFDVPRLPCLQSQLNYYRLSEAEFQLPPHPNVSELTSAFDLLPTAPPSERIVHVIGTDGDHDLCLAIKTAAQHVGRTCWSLRGLAAFAHAEGQTVRTGSLVDQLAGLDAALDEIHRCRMEPCVLNLYDIDGELSSTDEPLSHDQQERIWAKLMRAVARTTLESVDDNQANSTVRRNSCPLIIVLATSVPLKPGPWMQNLVFPSIVLAKPNAVYTRFLLEDVSLDDASLELLYGRSAREIRKIRQEVVGIEDIEEARLVLKRECDAFDDKRRKQRSATVSQVRWEDVGGMAYVRDEIMDAIELPLKHPHLFPNGQGRRGILLYGMLCFWHH